MSQILTPPTLASLITDYSPATAPVRTVHIDRIHVTGPLDHKPLGELFYKLYDGIPVAVGASAFKPNSKRNPDEVLYSLAGGASE